MRSVPWLAPMALGILLMLAVCQPGGQSAAPSTLQVSDARNAWRQVRGTLVTSKSWAFRPAEAAGFDGNPNDWPVYEKDRRNALAAGSQISELFAKLTTTTKSFHGIKAVGYGASGEMPQASPISTAELSYLRQAGADPDDNAYWPLAAWRVINS